MTVSLTEEQRKDRAERTKRMWADPHYEARFRVGLAKTMWRTNNTDMTEEQRALYVQLTRRRNFPASEARRIVLGDKP